MFVIIDSSKDKLINNIAIDETTVKCKGEFITWMNK